MTRSKKVDRAARQLFRRCLVDDRLDDDRVRLTARRIAASGRRKTLPILSAFRRLVRLDRDRHTARVESAVPLPASVRDAVHADLLRRYGAGLHESFEENSALIGGIRIRVGSDVYDGSVRGRLAALARRL